MCIVNSNTTRYSLNYSTQYTGQGLLEYKIYGIPFIQKFWLWHFMITKHYLNTYESNIFHIFRNLKKPISIDYQNITIGIFKIILDFFFLLVEIPFKYNVISILYANGFKSAFVRTGMNSVNFSET